LAAISSFTFSLSLISVVALFNLEDSLAQKRNVVTIIKGNNRYWNAPLWNWTGVFVILWA